MFYVKGKDLILDCKRCSSLLVWRDAVVLYSSPPQGMYVMICLVISVITMLTFVKAYSPCFSTKSVN